MKVLAERTANPQEGTKKVYRFEEHVQEDPIPPPPMGEHEEVTRTEWINPPTVIGGERSVRGSSPARTATTRRTSPSRTTRTRSRAPSMPGGFYEERKTVIEESGPPPGAIPIPAYPPQPYPPQPPPADFYEERRTVIDERFPPPPPPGAPTMPSAALVVRDPVYRSDRDIHSEIRALEAERRALRLERDAEEKRDMALRPRDRGYTEEELQIIEYRDRPRERLFIEERERSPPRNVVRVEKDRKGRMALVRSAH